MPKRRSLALGEKGLVMNDRIGKSNTGSRHCSHHGGRVTCASRSLRRTDRRRSMWNVAAMVAAVAVGLVVTAPPLHAAFLVPVQQLFSPSSATGFLGGVRAVAVSPDGAHVYVASELDDAVAAFRRDSVTGRVSLVDVKRNGVDGVTGIDGAESVAIRPMAPMCMSAGS